MFIRPSEDRYANHFALLKAALVEVSSGAVTEGMVQESSGESLEEDSVSLSIATLAETFSFSYLRESFL